MTSTNPTFSAEIEEAAHGEPIESIIVEHTDKYGSPDTRFEAANAFAGKLVSWEVIKPLLSYKYDGGFGGADCHAFTAWTASRVLFVHEYDGATSVRWLPRNPVVHHPEMSGCNDFWQTFASRDDVKRI